MSRYIWCGIFFIHIMILTWGTLYWVHSLSFAHNLQTQVLLRALHLRLLRGLCLRRFSAFSPSVSLGFSMAFPRHCGILELTLSLVEHRWTLSRSHPPMFYERGNGDSRAPTKILVLSVHICCTSLFYDFSSFCSNCCLTFTLFVFLFCDFTMEVVFLFNLRIL